MVESASLKGWSRLLHDLRSRRRRFRQFLGWALVLLFTALGDPRSLTLFAAGAAVVAAGAVARLWASGVVHKNKALATGGPYGFVRHPLYTGNLLIATGFCLASGLWWSPLVVGAFYFGFYPDAIEYEDKKLARLFPGEWPEWAARIPAVVPRLVRPKSSGPVLEWSFRRSLLENGEPIYALIVAGCCGWLYFAGFGR
ncbi:MAG: isoprenylcysteine carboxylmethyltransferase family protein [Planctomycetota bacterium]|nr:isoprenylcysteine carboxylmethyltransferase family protein [Planctomycetota bacterium]